MADEEGTAADDGAQGAETVLSPAGACDAPVRESCDFRVEENRPCRSGSDGMTLPVRPSFRRQVEG